MNKVIAYYRVSTEDQNLGIPAQKKTVKDFAKRIGVEILEEFQDKASGSKIKLGLKKLGSTCERTGMKIAMKAMAGTSPSQKSTSCERIPMNRQARLDIGDSSATWRRCPTFRLYVPVKGA